MSAVVHTRVEGLAPPVDIRDNARPAVHGAVTAFIRRRSIRANLWASESPMRFPPQFLDELRARLQVSDVVGRLVKLKKAGREWKGLSPFNKERTPSFFVNDQKVFYHDFSSGNHGDIFKF